MYTKTKTQKAADERQARKFQKLLKQIPFCLNNHKPSVISWMEGEMSLTAATSYDLTAVNEIFKTIRESK